MSDRRQEARQPGRQPALAGTGQFADPGLLDTLESVSLDLIDAFSFGLVVMDRLLARRGSPRQYLVVQLR